MKAPCRCADVASTSPRCAVTGAAPLHRLHHARRCSAPSQGRSLQTSCINPRKINSINAAAAVPVEKPETASSTSSHRNEAGFGFASDVLGLGQAIVDLSSSVNDDCLTQFNVPKGGRRVITVDERASIMETLDSIGAPSQVSAGGSLANTLVGVAKLSRAAGRDLRVTLGGSLGTDTLGQFFNSQMRQAGVRCLLDTHHHHHHQHDQQQQQSHGAMGHTGTVMVLTTPDAQRSFLSFFTSETLSLSERLRSAVRASRLVVVEGYMWEMPGAEDYISQVVELAHSAGAQVALTAGDPGVVTRHRDAMLRVIARGVDMLFTNEDEAAALVGLTGAAGGAGQDSSSGGGDVGGSDLGEQAARALAELCHITVVTAGSKGSYVCAMGEMHTIPPFWLPQGPVDTCGAGDAYAAGWLYALLVGFDLRTAGEFASRVASAVISRYGPHLTDEDADELVRQLPEHVGPLRVRRLGDMELGAGGFADF